MMMVNHCHSSSSSLKHRIKSSVCGGFSCFGADEDSYQHALNIREKQQHAAMRFSPRAWLKSTAQDLPEIRDLCRGFIARMGKCRKNGHGLADLGYDPMSYALNFEDDRSREDDEDFPFRSFSSRLPASPERQLSV